MQQAGKVIGTAIGMLLGRNQEERGTIKKALVDACEIRNARVHGNVKKLAKLNEKCGFLSHTVEDYLRRTLQRFVEE